MISTYSTHVLQITLLCAFLLFPSQLLADKCGTFGNRFHARQDALSKGENLLAPDLPFSFVSSNNHFEIHYSKSGEGAVDPTDNDKNTIPDYVEECARAFEYAYAIEVDSMGFPPPPNNGENGAAPYDVYIREFANQGYYGLTTVIESLPNSTSRHSYSRTYIEVDNNYSISDKNAFGNQSFNTFGLDALKITAAHEFHHAIQLANFGINDQQYDVSFYEMFSTWLEFHIYPDIKDYHFYVRNYFLEPKMNRFGQRYIQEIASGYANALFFEYLYGKVGYSPILQTWQEIGRKTYAYHALEMALQNNSTPLHELWCGYQERVFLTGKRAVNKDSHELFRDARLFPELKGRVDSADPVGLFTGSIFPYEFSLNSCVLPGFAEIADTAHILFSNTFQDCFKYFGISSLSYSVIVNNDENKTPIGLSNYYLDINASTFPACTLIRLADGKLPLSSSRVYPNPLILSKHKSINFPVPNAVTPGDMVDVKIFTPSGIPMISKQVPISIDYDNSSTSFTILMAKLDEIQGFEPGVYIFTVNKEGNNETATGKFIVRP